MVAWSIHRSRFQPVFLGLAVGGGAWMSCTVTTGSAEENLLSVNAGLFILASQALWKIAMVLVSGGEEAEKHL